MPSPPRADDDAPGRLRSGLARGGVLASLHLDALDERPSRRLLHDEITKQELSIEEIRAIAEDIAQQFPKGGR